MSQSPSSVSIQDVYNLYHLPFNTLLDRAHQTHIQHFDANEVERCKLLSIKTGRCPEDCAYCPQSAHYQTEIDAHKLMDIDVILGVARDAKQKGAQRFCMGGAWRSMPKKEVDTLCKIIEEVKALGLETCITMGMISEDQAHRFKEAGLDYYNHNLDTSPEYYQKIITTRTYQERLDTIANVVKADIQVCCGGIMGMGEEQQDRIGFLYQLTQLPKAPDSIPLGLLVAIKGTPLADTPPLDPIEFIRTVATARILFPHAMIRLSGGRLTMNALTQAICYFAGANSIFIENCLTTPLPSVEEDASLFEKLGLVERV